MNARFVSVLSFAAILAVPAASDALAQRGGGHGGAMGGGMGGGIGAGVGAGMPSGMQHGATGRMPADRGADFSSPRGQTGDVPSGQRGGKTPSDLLQQNTKLSDNLAKLLPAGTDLQSASSGFRNLGEFVAAVHVSNNLGIPFADLKTKLMDGASLGGAIRALRPGADDQVESRRARAMADNDLKS